jgi:hypothetical protein
MKAMVSPRSRSIDSSRVGLATVARLASPGAAVDSIPDEELEIVADVGFTVFDPGPFRAALEEV